MPLPPRNSKAIDVYLNGLDHYASIEAYEGSETFVLVIRDGTHHELYKTELKRVTAIKLARALEEAGDFIVPF